MVRGIPLGKSFWVVNTWRAPVRKPLKGSTLNFAHISNRLLQKTVPAFFLIMSYSFFMVITRRALKGYFALKQLKADYSKIFGKKKIAGTVSFVSWLATYQWKKLLKTAILLVQELRIYEKWLVFGPTLTLILPIFGECEKGKLYILKKVGLSAFKEIL